MTTEPVDLDAVRRLCEQASDGPWEVGVTYLTAGVARPADGFAELGKCAACHHGEPVWTGVADVNGAVRDAHQHRVSLDVLDDPSVYGGPAGQPKGVVVQGADDFGRNLSPQDAAFIAAARTLVPELVAEVERLRPVVEAAQAWYAHSTLSEPHEAALGAAVETYEAAGGEVR